MVKPAVLTALLLITVASLISCGGGAPEIKVSYPGGADDDGFELLNASDQEWSHVTVLIRRLRPDGIEAECAQRQIEAWQPGEAQLLPRCAGDKTLITIEAGDQKAYFVLAGETLYQKFGRRQVKLSG